MSSSASSPPTGISAVKLALACQQARDGENHASLLRSDPIAIVGMACRFPGGADDLDGYWRVLEQGIDAVREVPADRWPGFDQRTDLTEEQKRTAKWGGFLSDVASFDAGYFGISPKEAAVIDPQHRLLLEVTWEAIADAGIPYESLSGKRAGVFLGAYYRDYGEMQMRSADGMAAHTVSGNLGATAAGRISYLLNLNGPNIVYDTACSSSLVAIQAACAGLREEESTVALAGGVSLILRPEGSLALIEAGLLASDGRCKTFDAAADGFVRGEGCGILVLKRLSDAIRQGDRVHAVIRGAAVNHDGRSSFLTAPSGPAQEDVMRQALVNARMEPAEVNYLEAHGTGTQIGDPIELEALVNVYGEGRAADNPCRVGSVKANLGHLEAAAGVSGVIKIVLSMQHESTVPQLHYHQPNPLATLGDSGLHIDTLGGAWKPESGLRVAGISGFGFGGTNAHLILEQAPALPKRSQNDVTVTRSMSLSAPSAAGLRAQIRQYEKFLSSKEELNSRDLSDICYTAAVRREHHEYRVAVLGESKNELIEELSALKTADFGSSQPKLAMVFSGQGTQWAGMGQALAAREPVFRAALEECAAAMHPWADWDLFEVLWSDKSAEYLEHTQFAQPAIFAIQIALARLWESWGIVPAGVVGHSVGEIAATVVAGIFSIQDAARLIIRRGELLNRLSGGGMLAVRASEAELKKYISRNDAVEFAAINSPSATVLSGSLSDLETIQSDLTRLEIPCQILPVSAAFHSKQVAPLEADLIRELEFLAPQNNQLPFYSTVEVEIVSADNLSADYWRRNMRHTVRFHDTIERLLTDGFNVLLEIGPHAALVSPMLEIARSAGQSISAQVTVQASMRRDDSTSNVMLQSIAALYTAGCNPIWRRLYPADSRCVSLPNYHWQRERHWIQTTDRRSETPLKSLFKDELLVERITSPFITEPIYSTRVTPNSPAELKDHVFVGKCVLPAALMIELIASSALEVLNNSTQAMEFPSPVVLKSIQFKKAIILDVESNTEIQYRFSESSETNFSIEMDTRRKPISRNHSDWQTTLQAELDRGEATEAPPYIELQELFSRCLNVISKEQFAESMTRRGAQFGPHFSLLEKIHWGSETVISCISNTQPLGPKSSFPLPCTLLDAAMQTAECLAQNSDEPGIGLPVSMDRLTWYSPLPEKINCCVQKQIEACAELSRYDLMLTDDHGRVCVSMQGLCFRRTTLAELQRLVGSDSTATLNQQTWNPLPNSAFSTEAYIDDRNAHEFVILGEKTDFQTKLNTQLSQHSTNTSVLAVSTTDADEIGDLLSRMMDQSEVRPLHFVYLVPSVAKEHTQAESLSSKIAQAFETFVSLVRLASDIASTCKATISIITHGSQRVNTVANDNACELDPIGAAIWGAAHAAALEHPHLKFDCLDLDESEEIEIAIERVATILTRRLEMPRRLAWRKNNWYQAGILPVENDTPSALRDTISNQSSGLALCRSDTGLIKDVTLRPRTRRAPQPDEIEIAVESTGLNFRDVMRSLGMLSDSSEVLGAECAGRVIRVGDKVQSFTVGERVMAFAPQAFQSFVTVNVALASKIPDALNNEQSGANVVAFLTVQYGLKQLAKLKSGECVLVHAGTGGVGLAAIQLCHSLGAEVIATAGSEEKRRYLSSLGVNHVFDSRSLDFTQQILSVTSGRGVDVVLNSLSGDFVPASLQCLAKTGRFIELGKRGVWSAEQVRQHRPDVTFHIFDLSEVAQENPATITELFCDCCEAFQSGACQPLPQRSFGIQDASHALEYMQHARHIGKVTLIWPALSAEGSTKNSAERPIIFNGPYLITGGMGALGLHAARWLVANGAKSLVLLGRNQPSMLATRQINTLLEAGVEVRCLYCDVSDQDTLVLAIKEVTDELGPIRGVIHSAGVLDDGPVTEMSAERFLRVAQAKVDAITSLKHVLQTSPLEFFVTYSSLAAVTGWPGQSNYAAANAAMDALVFNLSLSGMPTTTIHWGPWANAGMAAEVQEKSLAHWGARGLTPLRDDEANHLLSSLLRSKPSEAIAATVDWNTMISAFPNSGLQPLVSDLDPDSRLGGSMDSVQKSWGEQLAAIAAEDRPTAIASWVQAAIVRVLGLPSNRALPPHRPLRELGLDSLLAVELRNVLCRESGESLLTMFAYDYPTLSAMCDWFIETLTKSPAGQTELTLLSPSIKGNVSDANVSVDDITDEQAEALLLAELADLEGKF